MSGKSLLVGVSGSRRAGVVLSQRSSGLSVSAFCRREGISPATFYRWRREVGRERASFAEVRVKDVAKAPAAPSDAPGSCSVPVEMVLASGDRLRLSGPCDPVWLGRIVAVLRGRSC
jgi:transposase-like protein